MKLLLENIRKMIGSKIVQVKVIMPPKDGIMRKTPTGKPLGQMWYGITFTAVQKFVMLWENFIGIAM